MPSIIISADSNEVGRQIADKTAAVLGYNQVGRNILGEVAHKRDVPETELARALDDATRLSRIVKENLVYIREATVERFLEDDLVCEGIAAHLFLREVPHILMVRILSDSRVRYNRIAAVKHTSPRRAIKMLERQEKRRQLWSLKAFGVDKSDPSLYDIVICLNQIEQERAVKIINETVTDRKFQRMTYSRKLVEDEVLTSRVQAALVHRYPEVRVKAREDTVVLHLPKVAFRWRKKAEAIKQIANEISGVNYIEVHRDKNPSG